MLMIIVIIVIIIILLFFCPVSPREKVTKRYPIGKILSCSDRPRIPETLFRRYLVANDGKPGVSKFHESRRILGRHPGKWPAVVELFPGEYVFPLGAVFACN